MDWERTKVKNFTSTVSQHSRYPISSRATSRGCSIHRSRATPTSGTNLAQTDALGRPVAFGAVYDPASTRLVNGTYVRDMFPGNIIPRSRWSPVSQKILELAPIDDPLFDTMLNNIPALGSSSPVFDEKMLSLKGDHNFTTSHRVSGLFNRNFRARKNSPGGRWGIPPEPRQMFTKQTRPERWSGWRTIGP